MTRTLIPALLGALAPAGCATYTGTPAQAPPIEPGSIVWPTTPFDCSTLAAEPDKPAELPEGAGRITLCNEPGHPIELAPPPDALVEDPLAVVAAYHDQEHVDLASMACTADLGPAYRLVVEYPEGQVVTLRGELYGCRVVGDKTGAQHVLDAFTQALATQRQTQPPPEVDPLAGAACGHNLGGGSWIAAAMDDTVAGYRCLADDADPVLLGADDWATLRDDWAANAHEGPRTGDELADCTQSTADVLTGVTPWGEGLSLHGLCGVFESWPTRGAEPWVWRPGPAASEVLARQG